MPFAATVIALTAGVAYGARQLARWRREREAAARLPVGPDGIIRGAGPISLDGTRPGAVLLLHGFGDTPQTLGGLAEHLAARGWTVRAPLLPGHGRTIREFARSDAARWVAAAQEALDLMRDRHGPVHVVGLSMGGALGAIAIAGRGADEVPSLTLLSPYLEMPRPIRRLARCHRLFSLVVPYADGRGDRSIHDPEAAARALGYGVVTPRLLRELLVVVERAQEALPRVAVPTLYVQSREDNRIALQAARLAFERLGAADKRQEWLDGCGHIVTVDHERARVYALVEEWIAAHESPRPQTADATLASVRAAGSM